MKRLILMVLIVVTLLCISLYFGIIGSANTPKEVHAMVNAIHWLGHDCFKIVSNVTIYTDPYNIKKQDKADIILITHEHFDHLSPDDIKKIQTKDTVIVAPADCVSKLTGTVKTIKPNETITVKGITIQAIPAYNTNKQFHQKSKGWVGYIITANNTRIYLAGDTDYIPEMNSLHTIDIALLPVSGTYVMTAEEAAQAAMAIKPKVAIPMHYGAIVGTIADAKKFEKLLKGKIEVVIKEIEQ
ncbi:MAG: MBL fold metallo-hydrolase [Spirochaetota bacterium]